MKHLFSVFIIIFMCISMYAEKRDFLSSDRTQMGTIEINSDGTVYLVSLTIHTAMPSPSKNIISGILIQFDSWQEALDYYETTLSVKTFDDFLIVLNNIRNTSVVLDIPSQNWTQGNVNYSMKLINYKQLITPVSKTENNKNYGEYTPYTAKEIFANPSSLENKKIVLTNCKVSGVDPINSEGLICWLASGDEIIAIMVPGLTANGIKAVTTYASNKNKKFDFYGQFVYKSSYNYYILLEKLEVCN